ncbi:hypothetical protein GQ44DRAFT_804020 [Phaeosphaeriaceae sp. PMI808]|nr:hypothetical protein GQ44DRAFT_804020 [Phaeosphaeriaceae sp. PMI808]
MTHLPPWKNSTPSLCHKQSESGSLTASLSTASDQRPRDEKSAQYSDVHYETLLKTKGSYMTRYVGENGEEGVTKEGKAFCQTLLESEQTTAESPLFQDEIFQDICNMPQERNEAKAIQNISRLLVPSAECLAICGSQHGAKHLQRLTESVNEGWNCSIPLKGTRLQPDYSVGFRREAFSEEQRNKLAPFVGNFIAGDQSYFMATYYMYFPFLTCEVSTTALDIADRQNAHSMTLAVRGVVELFRLVKRENEINREIHTFSISYDDQWVQIYGHYAVVEGSSTTFYQLDGRGNGLTYKFTKSVYNTWMLTHFERLCSAIGSLPSEINFDV